MSEIVITVRGRYAAWYPAERATARVSIRFDGPQREPVFAKARAAADAVRATIQSRHDAEKGPITWWSAESVRVWSQRPWSDKGVQLPPVHYAALDVTAKFRDFEELARWIETIVEIDGVNVADISWALTEATTASVTAEVHSRAVKDAVARATVYAQSVGLSSVTATEIADTGMLASVGAAHEGADAFMAVGKMSAGSSDGDPFALKPEDIEVTASVDARFTAS
jgi:uncharacterized protein